MQDATVSGVIRQRLSKAPADTRTRLMRLAGLIPDRGLVRDLGPFLADPDPQVRADAAGAILSILERTQPRKP